jgi:hypothetical protein
MVEAYPEKKCLPETAKVDKQRKFKGALPTTIYQAGFSEVYGQNPDTDSTSLISTSNFSIFFSPVLFIYQLLNCILEKSI